MCHFSFDDVFFREAEYIKPTLFAKIAESVLPLAHTLILSAGNEPLTSPFFVELLKISSKYSIPNVLFITNAQRLRPKVADAVIESGVTQVQISIDGATKDTYEYVRRGARFDRLIHNIEYITDRKRKLGTHLPQLQFNLVLMRRNLHELDQFVDLAEDLGVEWIGARHLLIRRGLNMEEESLAKDFQRTNYYFKKFLARVDKSKKVFLIHFPDLFDLSSRAPNPTCPSAGVQVAATGPLGCVDAPRGTEICAHKTIRFEGWALDEKGPCGVTVEREPFTGEAPEILNERGLVSIGEAQFTPGARPDVADAFPDYPQADQAGWSFELHHSMVREKLPLLILVHVVATGTDGRASLLGKREVLFSPPNSVTPYLRLVREPASPQPGTGSSGGTSPSVGFVDIPSASEVHGNNAIYFEGWALDEKQVWEVLIEREPFGGEQIEQLSERGFVPIGRTQPTNGTRPDVARAFPNYPHGHRAGWSFELRREMISSETEFTTSVHIFAVNIDGLATEIGKREVSFTSHGPVMPYLFCARPFDSVFIDAKGEVNPYPDCRPEQAYGSLREEGSSFEEIWFGSKFMDLRTRIINREPPPMCLSCALFINRNVNDENYFELR